MVTVVCLVTGVAGLCLAESTADAARAAIQMQVWRIAAREGVDPRLAEAVAETESAYDAWAVSSKGAVGVMQLTAALARDLGVRDRRDVQESVTAAVRYLRYLQWYYRGDLRLVLAAYSAGAGAVAKYRGVPPCMETREYITAVLERYYGVRVGQRARSAAVQPVVLAGGPSTCGGSEMAYDASGRLYVRARSRSAACVGARER